mgnify:CR=1 FL=1
MGGLIRCQGITFHSVTTVIFDKDGTLAHSSPYLCQLGRSRIQLLDAEVPGIRTSLARAFGFDGSTLHPQGLLAVGSRRENEIAAATYIAEIRQEWITSLDMVKTAFAAADAVMPPKSQMTALIPGCAALIQALSRSNIQLGMLSADVTRNVVDFAKHHQIAHCFEFLAGVDSVDKGDKKACRQFFQQHKINPQTTIVIGDSASDIKLSKALGTQSIGATWGWEVDYVIEDADAIALHPNDITVTA